MANLHANSSLVMFELEFILIPIESHRNVHVVTNVCSCGGIILEKGVSLGGTITIE